MKNFFINDPEKGCANESLDYISNKTLEELQKAIEEEIRKREYILRVVNERR